MKLEPIKKEDLFTELGKNSRLIKLTVDAKKSITKEVGSIPVKEVIESIVSPPKPEEFFFKVIEEEYNEQS